MYVDFSKASMLIAQAKVTMRRCSKIVWVTEWIESIPRLGLGKFDLVSCTGVLHHIKCPQMGLDILKELQVQYGGLNVMVHAKYGRTGIYQIQDLFRIINIYEKTMLGEVANARLVLKVLPQYHWSHQVPLIDSETLESSRIYDLLLHKRDVSYSVPDLYEWLQRSNVYFIDFSFSSIRIGLSLKLKIPEKLFYTQITKMSVLKQRSTAEIITGDHYKQEFYASKFENAEASPERLNNVLFAYGFPGAGFRNTISDRSNYIQLRNETYIYAQLNKEAIFAWPSTEFNNVVIVSLTMEPTKPKSLFKMISKYRNIIISTFTIKQLNNSFKVFYSYIKDTGLFLVKKGMWVFFLKLVVSSNS